MRLYVGNFNYNTSEQDLKELFGEVGRVSHVKIITDRETGRSKGYGFVEMPNESHANECVQSYDGLVFDGRTLKVKIAHSSTNDE